jgi:hypothetical protein
VENQLRNQWAGKELQFIPSLRKWLHNALWDDALVPPGRKTAKSPATKPGNDDEFCPACDANPCRCRKEKPDVPF